MRNQVIRLVHLRSEVVSDLASLYICRCQPVQRTAIGPIRPSVLNARAIRHHPFFLDDQQLHRCQGCDQSTLIPKSACNHVQLQPDLVFKFNYCFKRLQPIFLGGGYKQKNIQISSMLQHIFSGWIVPFLQDIRHDVVHPKNKVTTGRSRNHFLWRLWVLAGTRNEDVVGKQLLWCSVTYPLQGPGILCLLLYILYIFYQHVSSRKICFVKNIASGFAPRLVRFPENTQASISRIPSNKLLVVREVQQNTAIAVRVKAQMSDVHDVRQNS